MRYVKTANLKTGDILARSIYNLGGHTLVNSNTVLTPFLIKRLDALGYPGVYLFDSGETEAALKLSLDDHIRMRAAADIKNIDIDKCIYAANEIVTYVLSMKDIAMEVSRISSYDMCTWTHSVDVCTYAVMCGVAMGLNGRELKELSQAALLHDIGKTMISLKILNKPGKLTSEEFTVIKNHPRYGYELIRNTMSFSATVFAAIYEHHENEDGSGYPRGVTGDRIHKFAKILHATDVYEACTAVRPYKKQMNPADVMENLMSGYGTLFDKTVIDVMRSIIVLYPVGCRVLLSDGRTGTVIENRRQSLSRPIVKCADGTVVDLLPTFDLTVLELID